MGSATRKNVRPGISMEITLGGDESGGLPAIIYRNGKEIGEIRLRFWDWPFPKPHNIPQIKKVFDLLIELADLAELEESRGRQEQEEIVLTDKDASERFTPDFDWVCQELVCLVYVV